MAEQAKIERQALLELPLPERIVAVSIKNLFDQIKKIQQQENEQINRLHLKTLEAEKTLIHQTANIVRGQAIPEALLSNVDQFLTSSELSQKKKVVSEHKGLKNYWQTVFQNHYQDALQETDIKLFASLSNLESKVSEDTMELIFEFAQSDVISAGKYARRLTLTNGSPSKFDGDFLKWKIQNPEIGDVVLTVFDDSTDQQLLGVLMLKFGQFINQIIPYSLEYYLGIQEEQMDDFEQGEDEEEEESMQGKKKRKIGQ